MTHDAEGAAPVPVARASDAERETAAEHLRTAVADGRLDLTELDERLTAVYQAKTRAELATVTHDLEPGVLETKPLTLRTKSGSLRRTGSWTAPVEIVAQCTSGSIKIDFTGARVPQREVTVHATAKSGSVVLVVPTDWAVVMDDVTSGSGTITNKVAQRDPTTASHTVRVVGSVASGVIKARYPRRSFIDWLLRRPH
ncbi:DUF1707 SHOCT-like domain-containing protein [Microlunatus soli]|uniref:DUF1707 domain-containing protein n=1 Tax=Microlunatus soli TaxID=630515 RepID=A0A1H1YUJ2_9ACTN|nr:DUF1707 domain-containing protein [Microlunatus soli]SDT24959.1 protein of unknown function [Microlunatus soli]